MNLQHMCMGLYFRHILLSFGFDEYGIQTFLKDVHVSNGYFEFKSIG